MSWSGAAEVVRALEDEGIPFAFGIPGTHNIELYDALAESKSVRSVLVTDEQSASFMADGVWRASGRLACVNVVPGAGLTHALSGIAEAFLDNVPLLVLACGIRRDTGMGFQLHDVDQLAIARPVTKGTFQPTGQADIRRTIRHACALARSGAPGPVVVEIPAELYMLRGRGQESFAERGAPATTGASEDRQGDDEPADDDLDAEQLSAAGERDAVGEPDAGDLDRAAEILREAARPLLYLGLGAAPAGRRLVELAELLESPVATTIQGKGVFPESHPLALWPGLGNMAPPFVREVAGGCDATLAIGCRFSEVGTGSYGFSPPAPLIHVDIDPRVLGRNLPTRLTIEADSARFVNGLLERLAERRRDPALREAIRAGRLEVWKGWLDAAGGEGVTPAHLLRRLQDILGPDTIFTTDSGNGTFLAMECLSLDGPGRFLAPVDFSCMGYAVPAAIGAKLARPEAPVVALVGDGAFLMTGLELLTAAREGTGVAALVLRDRELAQIAQFQEAAFHRKACSVLPDYDLVSLCAGMGVECLDLPSNDRVDPVLERVAAITAEGRPAAVEVAIDYSQKTFFTRGVVKTNFGRLPWRDRFRVLARAAARRLTG
ncbi:MAG: thiamine pyrophosphate-binding protein [Gemmatimonadota bacterium]